MAWSFGKKKKDEPTTFTYGSAKKKGSSFGAKMGKLKGSLKKAFLIAVVGTAAIGGPGYYNYGTVHEQEVTVKSVDNNWLGWDSDKQEAIYDYKITTDKGVMKNEDTYLHLKFDSKEMQQQFEEGKVYRVKTYGTRFNLPFGIHDFYPNVVSAHEVTPAEMAARKKAAVEAKTKETLAQAGAVQQTPTQQPAANVAPVQQQPVLSGSMITYEVVADGERVQMTVPVEAAGKITINKVSPLVPVVAPKPPGT